ncbi:MAG: tetratricopeptide repeat protein [Candidatus Lokiarchaeota archaeon]|nr:tetratricopeptide repeat protein [Candidatus Lokiarchaeota archaeon]
MKIADFKNLFESAQHLFNQGKNIKALKNLEEAMKYANEEEQSQGFELFGKIYNRTQEMEKALAYYLKALKGTVNVNNRISILNKIALLYAGKKNYEKSIEYYNKCLEKVQEMADINKEMLILKNLGKLYMRNDEYIDALKCHQRVLALKRLAGDKLGEAANLRYIGQTYENSGNFEIAKDYYMKSVELYKQIGDMQGVEKVQKLIEDLEELEEEIEEEADLMDDWNIQYDSDDFF